MEANKYAFKAVGHTCDAPNDQGIYSNCDKGGKCGVDVLRNGVDNDYGPGEAYTINTERTFTVKTKFNENGGTFTGYTIVLQQDNRSVTLDSSNCDYLQGMSASMKNMAFVISNWGMDNLDWLQHGVCSGSCSNSDTLSVFSNLRIYASAYSVNLPPFQPSHATDGKFKSQALIMMFSLIGLLIYF